MRNLLDYIMLEDVISVFISGLTDKKLEVITSEVNDGIQLSTRTPTTVFTKNCDQELVSMVFGENPPNVISFGNFTINMDNDFILRDGEAARISSIHLIHNMLPKNEILTVAHNIHGPAQITILDFHMFVENSQPIRYHIGKNIIFKWYQNDKLFREMGPEIVYAQDKITLKMVDGKPDMDGALAFIWTQGVKSRLSPEYLYHVTNEMNLKLDLFTLGQSIFPNPVDQIAFMQRYDEDN